MYKIYFRTTAPTKSFLLKCARSALCKKFRSEFTKREHTIHPTHSSKPAIDLETTF